MSTIVTRAGKGSALTFSEVDSNFVNLNTDKYQSGDAASLASLTLGTPLAAASGGTGLSALGANVATWLGTPSSANLAAAVTDETGSGSLVFGTSPTLATPTITTSATCPLIIGGTGTTSTLTLRATSGAGTTGATIDFETGNNGATKAMTITNAGFVGINRTSPSFLLDVNGSTRFGDATVTGVLYMLGITPYITTLRTNLVLEQTGDTSGESQFRLQNRAGSLGGILQNRTLDYCELALQTSLSKQGNFRFEGRNANRIDTSNANGELQYVNNPVSSPSIVLAIGSSGLTINALPVKASSCISQQGISQNANTVDTSVTLASGCNGLSAGPMTVNTGRTVTVPTGQRWIIV